MELGDRIRHARKLAQMNQTDLGKRVGIKQSVVSDLETGEIRETAYLVQIAMVTGVDPVWLQTGKGAPIADELEIVQIWRDLDQERQARLLATARDLRIAQYGSKPSARDPFPNAPKPPKAKK